MCCIDLRYPQLRLLTRSCEVGVGAAPGLRRLLPQGAGPLASQLEQVTLDINNHAGEEFWELLATVERFGQNTCQKHPLLVKNLSTPAQGMTAATVQVQLCEWRQFLDYLATGGHGLGDNGSALAGADDDPITD